MPALKRVWDNYHELWRFLEEDGLVLYLQDDLRQFSVPWRRLAQDCEVLELDQEG